MIRWQTGLIRFVFIFGSPPLISVVLEDKGFGWKHHRNSSISMGAEVEFFLGPTATL